MPPIHDDLLPSFIIAGAMKCGTSTLAGQLGAQPGIFMTNPKEPNFFSDDGVYARGFNWYHKLFAGAAPTDIKGEASTHYTKLPTYPDCIGRMSEALEAPKLIYLIREPVSRAVSHYIHEWTMGMIRVDIDEALDRHPELISYGCYARQLAPYVERYGSHRIHVTALETMERAPQETLREVCRFIGYDGLPQWAAEQERTNVSSERIRRFPAHDLLINNDTARALRRFIVPRPIRDRIKKNRQMTERPAFSPANIARLQDVYAKDHAKLQRLFPNRPDLDISYPFASDDPQLIPPSLRASRAGGEGN